MELWRARTKLVVAVLALPLVAGLVWSLYRHVLIWTLPPPRWVVSVDGQYYGRCEWAANLPAYEAEPAEDSAAARITADHAVSIARWTVERHAEIVESGPFVVAEGPHLVSATFRDGGRRSAWYWVTADTGGAELLGEAAVVYVDATTGEPLVLITDAVVGDPQMACGGLTPEMALRIWEIEPLLATMVYAILLAILGGPIWLWRTVAARRTARRAGG